MGMINIAKDYRKYSPEDLRDYAYRGLLEYNGYDLSDFLEYLFQNMYSEQDLKETFEEGKKEAVEANTTYCSECLGEV